MVEKISINVKILSFNMERNFLVPYDMSVGDAIALIACTLKEEYRGAHVNRLSEYNLMQLLTGKILNKTCSFKQLGIVQGENFLLI